MHRAPAALLLTLILAGCGGAGPAGTERAPAPRERPDAATAAELEALYRARIDSARTRFTEADVRFMTGMIAHHAQALTMARMAPTHGAGPSVRTLAARIISAQEDEIATMQQWLRDRRQPVPEVHEMGGELRVHGAGHEGAVHGMLSQAQLRELDRARGAEFDRLFLRYMIQHHRGAVAMVEELFGTDGAAQDEEVYKFASDVHADQSTEVARMELMLRALQDGGAR